MDAEYMLRAIDVARRARGLAEPNPTVGCVIADDAGVIAEGWTQSYGSHHAEVHALQNVPDQQRNRLDNATLYVTLEPCCHHGKTPPCTDSILATAIPRIVVAIEDPFPKVAGKGIQQLKDAGREIVVGTEAAKARALIAPYLKLQTTGLPWVIAKWAMTLDGKIATAAGDSQWISSSASREIVHKIRGRVDAVMVGIGTAIADDPRLTARPEGPRRATRIVVDSQARLPLDCKLVKTARDCPVLLAVGPAADGSDVQRLTDQGVEVFQCHAQSHGERLQELMRELGSRRMTNVLVEGGGDLMGGLWDERLVDEVHVFVAPKIVGGASAITPIAGQGIAAMNLAGLLAESSWTQVEDDLYLSGAVNWSCSQAGGQQ